MIWSVLATAMDVLGVVLASLAVGLFLTALFLLAHDIRVGRWSR